MLSATKSSEFKFSSSCSQYIPFFLLQRLGISARNSLQYTVYSLVTYNGAEDSMYMKQDLQADREE